MLEEVTRVSRQEWCAQKAQKNQKSNKAGYTANTSRGRVGRGVFALSNSVITDGPMDQRTKPLVVTSPRLKRGPTEQPTDQPTDRTTDRPT